MPMGVGTSLLLCALGAPPLGPWVRSARYTHMHLHACLQRHATAAESKLFVARAVKTGSDRLSGCPPSFRLSAVFPAVRRLSGCQLERWCVVGQSKLSAAFLFSQLRELVCCTLPGSEGGVHLIYPRERWRTSLAATHSLSVSHASCRVPHARQTHPRRKPRPEKPTRAHLNACPTTAGPEKPARAHLDAFPTAAGQEKPTSAPVMSTEKKRQRETRGEGACLHLELVSDVM